MIGGALHGVTRISECTGQEIKRRREILCAKNGNVKSILDNFRY